MPAPTIALPLPIGRLPWPTTGSTLAFVASLGPRLVLVSSIAAPGDQLDVALELGELDGEHAGGDASRTELPPAIRPDHRLPLSASTASAIDGGS